MIASDPPTTRCGLDTVALARFERLLQHMQEGGLNGLFTAREIADAGEGAGKLASLAARFAAKEACCKMFPRETALGVIQPSDFGVRRDDYGAPVIEPSASARSVLD